jgi:hypothetical protein
VSEQNDWDDLAGLSTPAPRALSNAGYTRLVELANVSGREVKQLHGMGPKAFEALCRHLADQGLAFAD